MLTNEFIDLLKAIIRQPSVVGAEHSFFRVLQRELEERGAHVTWYEGLLVAQGSKPFSTMFSAHIDRHGLICTGPEEFQFAAFISANRTDLLNNSVSEELMTKVTERFRSEPVFAYEPWSGVYRGNGVIRNSYACEYRNNLIFEIDGLDDVAAGTPIAFNNKATQLIEDLCRDQRISYLYKDRYVEADNKRLLSLGEKPHSLGSTEMGRIIAASNGLVDGTTIQIPTTGYHTMEESASRESVDAFIRLLTTLSHESG